MTYQEAQEIYCINTEIKSLQAELAQHEQDRRYYKTVVLTDMPRGRGGYKNPTDEHLIKEQELKDMLRYALDRLQDKLVEFEKLLSGVEDAQTRTILRLRCINNMDWYEIGEEMCMCRTTASRKFRKFFEENGKEVD